MSYEECHKHEGADATNGCRWCELEAQLECKHWHWQCAECGLYVDGPFLRPHVQALELGMRWLTTPEYKR